MKHSTRILENMLAVLKYLADNPCIDCGESDPRVLDFDHRSEKNFCIGDSLTRSTVSLDVLIAEISLCDVRCSNCHRKKHNTNSYRAVPIETLENEIFKRTFLGVGNYKSEDVLSLPSKKRRSGSRR